jgi:hypothetical protein
MLDSFPSDPELLKALLEPLLDDFQYWFGRSRTLLEDKKISFLGSEAQAALLARLTQAQQEVSTAQLLFRATNGQAGIEPSVLAQWHRLVIESWQVAMQFRLGKSSEKASEIE